MCLHSAKFLHEKGYCVDFAVGSVSKDLVKNKPYINDCIVIDEDKLFKNGKIEALQEIIKLNKNISYKNYDLVFLGHSDWRYKFLVLPIIFSSKIRSFHPVRGINHIEEYVRMVSTKDEAKKYFKSLITKDDDMNLQKVKRIVMAPGGAKNILRNDAQRRWPIQHYVKLVQFINKKYPDVDIILIGAHSDSWVLDYFVDVKFINQIGENTISGTQEVIKKSHYFISHDSGPLHFSLNTNTPTIALFGPTEAKEKFFKNNIKSRVLITDKKLDCMPCYDSKNYKKCFSYECMETLSVNKVFSSIEFN